MRPATFTRNLFVSLLSFAVSLNAAGEESIKAVDKPDTSSPNPYYIGNKAPLSPSCLLKLPIGTIKPSGWLGEYLKRQRDGLTGHLGEISAWLQKEDNAWLSKDGKGRWGWEEVPYWLKGYGDLSYILNDPKMIAETKTWIDGVLRSQRSDGDFGPDEHFKDDGSRDYWANMIMLFCLQSYYDYSSDPRVLELMIKYFKYQLGVPDKMFLTHHWQKARGGDNLYSVYWLYNRTGDAFLLELAQKIHRMTWHWKIPDDLPGRHNVDIAQGFREPATYYLQSHDPTDLKATYDDFRLVRERYGEVPGGMWGGDENSRRGYNDPHQAIETCGIVEQMLSNELLIGITGDPFWSDHTEEIAFNTYPAAVMPDFRALRYLTAPNMVLSDDKNHAPGIDNKGPFLMMNPFSSRCCQHNHSHGWPYFSENLWTATPDRGICATLYAPNTVRAKVGDGTDVQITEETRYPFDDKLHFAVNTPKMVEFPLYLRIPSWCVSPKLEINGTAVTTDVRPGQYLCIKRKWSDEDTVALQLPMEVRVRRWVKNHGSCSIDYGPLTFSLQIKENYIKVDSIKTVIGDSRWQKNVDRSAWPSYLVEPGSAWNYGLLLDQASPARSFSVERRPWPTDNFPFTQESTPIRFHAKGRKIPEWTLDANGLAGTLQDSPVKTAEPEESITLIPMGAARLRISAFPVVGDDASAHVWTPSASQP